VKRPMRPTMVGTPSCPEGGGCDGGETERD
jgi:hypothetical protein